MAAAARARRAARRRLRERDRVRRRRCRHRLRLHGDARPRRRGRHRLAVVSELRARPAEARRRARCASRCATSGSTSTRCWRDHAAHEARLHRRAEQPDRDDEHSRRARRVLRAGPAARPDGRRPGVLRVRRRARLPRCGRGVRRSAATACSSCARSRRSSASPACGSATASGPRTSITAIGKVRRAFDVTSAGQEAALASLGDDGRDRTPPRREPRRDGVASLAFFASHRLEPAGPAVANFLFVRVGDAERAERRAPPARRHRPPAAARSARRTRSASPPALPTRSRSSGDALDAARRSGRRRARAETRVKASQQVRRDPRLRRAKHGLSLSYPPPAGARRGARLFENSRSYVHRTLSCEPP